jgi:DNA-binding response OmpR family regulator
MTCRHRILLADDETGFAKITAGLFGKSGYRCDYASTGWSARKLLHENRYDALISDIRMPGNHDLMLAREAPRVRAEMPIVLITAYPSITTAVQAIELPVAAYMIKPFDFAELLDKVERVILEAEKDRSRDCRFANLMRWRRDLERFAETFGFSERGPETEIKKALVRITHNLRLIEQLSEDFPVETSICPSGSCGRLEELVQAVQETTQILEATKGSFKSKKLGKLRTKLEEVVRSLKSNAN